MSYTRTDCALSLISAILAWVIALVSNGDMIRNFIYLIIKAGWRYSKIGTLAIIIEIRSK